MYFEGITENEYRTLDLVNQKEKDGTLPTISATTKSIFAQYDEGIKAPESFSRQRNYYQLDREGVQKAIDKFVQKKHKIFSLLALAGTIAALAAVVITCSILCPPLLVTIAIFLVPFMLSSLYLFAAFTDPKEMLQDTTTQVKEIQRDAEALCEFMDNPGTPRLKEALEVRLALLKNPTNDQEMKEKSELETALYNLRLAEQFVADLAQAETEV